MNQAIVINKLAKELGLTSRTLRYWEGEGLFHSTRDEFSGWRVYDEDAVLCIQITMLLRKCDVPILEIKKVIQEKTFASLQNVIDHRINFLHTNQGEILQKKEHLTQLEHLLIEKFTGYITTSSITGIADFMAKTEETDFKEDKLSMLHTDKEALKVITLPPMRVVYHIVVNVSPEDEAMEPVITWLKSENLLGTARLFGGNMPPMPGKDGEPYGYGMCASIPETVGIPDNLQEMRLPGGLYATQESTDDVGASWKMLMNRLLQNEKYKADHKRLCFEEHIRNDNPDGCGNEYSIILFEPVKLK